MQKAKCSGFVDSRLRRFPPNRASAVPYGQAMDNALRCPSLAHRSAAAHKLHSDQATTIFSNPENQNQHSGTNFSLFHPGGCPSYRDHRKVEQSVYLHIDDVGVKEQKEHREKKDVTKTKEFPDKKKAVSYTHLTLPTKA